MLLLKSYRIYIIFDYQKTKHAISDIALIIGASLFALLNLILISIQIILSVPGPSTNVSSTGTQIRSCGPAPGKETIHNIMEYTVLAYNSLLILSCVFLSFKTRRAYARFAESKSIAVGVGVVAITFIFGIPIMASVSDLNDGKGKNISSFIRGMIFIVSSVAVAIALFVPRLSEVIHERRNKLAVTVAELRSRADGSVLTGGAMGMGFGQIESTIDGSGISGQGGSGSERDGAPRVYTFRVRIEGGGDGLAWVDGVTCMLPDTDEMVVLPNKVSEGKAAERIKLSSSTYRFPTVQVLPNMTEREKIEGSRVTVHVASGKTIVLEFEGMDKLKYFKKVLESASYGSHLSLLGRKGGKPGSIYTDNSDKVHSSSTLNNDKASYLVPQASTHSIKSKAEALSKDYEAHPLNLLPINPSHAAYFSSTTTTPPSPTDSFATATHSVTTTHVLPQISSVHLQSVPPSPQLAGTRHNMPVSPRSVPMQNLRSQQPSWDSPASPRGSTFSHPLTSPTTSSPRLPPAYVPPSPRLGGHSRNASGGGYRLDAMPGGMVASVPPMPMHSTGLGQDDRDPEGGERRWDLGGGR
ncbi:hypothetical protein HDV00_009570 [Rhizophlyctis rosea]|nr:hypothetical protein HDV00_009570 [Rhizophlyctis rosea]